MQPHIDFILLLLLLTPQSVAAIQAPELPTLPTCATTCDRVQTIQKECGILEALPGGLVTAPQCICLSAKLDILLPTGGMCSSVCNAEEDLQIHQHYHFICSPLASDLLTASETTIVAIATTQDLPSGTTDTLTSSPTYPSSVVHSRSSITEVRLSGTYELPLTVLEWCPPTTSLPSMLVLLQGTLDRISTLCSVTSAIAGASTSGAPFPQEVNSAEQQSSRTW